MKPIKIVYLSSPAFADYDFSLIKAFQQQGYDVYYFMLLAEYNRRSTLIDIAGIHPENDIIPANKYAELQRFSSYLDINKFFVINKVHRQDTHPLSLYLYWKLSRTISQINPDKIIAQPFEIAGLLLYKFRNRIRFVIHDPVLHTGESTLRKRLFRWICFRLGKKFFLLNKNQSDDFCKKHRINIKHVLVNELSAYDVYKVFANEAYPIQNREKNILFFGRISRYKGIEYLCEAMKKVHERIPEATLTIAGDGKMYIEPEVYKNKNYIEIINRFIPTEMLTSMIQESTVVCCPYMDATQSGVIMTAFAFQKPVVATRVGGIENQIDDGITGMLVPPCDAEALADALIGILSNQEHQETMANNLREKYHTENQPWGMIAKKYANF